MTHEPTTYRTPISVIVRCSCGWSATQSRRQNAFARATKLKSAWRRHLLDTAHREGATT
jgi:hypothetical protein